MLIAKLALGFASTVAMAGLYTFHQGLVQVDVDEFHSGGSHIHLWAPAAMIPVALHMAPRHHVQHAAEGLRPIMPAVRRLAKELRKYPNAEFVDVMDGSEHVQIRTRNGKLEIDVHDQNETVHVACPLATVEQLSRELEDKLPAA